jgi:hypothetical protein
MLAGEPRSSFSKETTMDLTEHARHIVTMSDLVHRTISVAAAVVEEKGLTDQDIVDFAAACNVRPYMADVLLIRTIEKSRE